MEHSHGAPSAMKGLEEWFEEHLHKKAPFHLPDQVKEWIVTYGPWIDLVILILSAPFILAALGLSLVFLPFAAIASPFHSGIGIVHWAVALAAFALQVMALPGLFKRHMSSWRLLYYATLIMAVSDLLARDIFGLIIGTAISLYILFQIKSKYH
jgi:hypothetical protein